MKGIAIKHLFDQLGKIRSAHGKNPIASLPDDVILEKLESEELLRTALSRSFEVFENLKVQYPEFIGLDIKECIRKINTNILSFYSADANTPYIPISSAGPWVVTFHGGIIYSSGGYGILGFGHNPDFLIAALSRQQTMANIMTPSFTQYRITNVLRGKIKRKSVYDKFAFMNTGSEANSVAARISDAHAKILTEPGARHFGKEIKYLALEGSFHGRTYDAAQASSSSYKSYKNYLASFRANNKLVTVEPNNLESLQNAFDDAQKNNVYFEMMFMEPVMGEGRAGYSITPEFYNLARKLTKETETLLLIDSIQAGLRCHGVLSFIDYPGFQNIDPPDFETFAKAINCGQYPISILAMNSSTAEYYKTGTYGNTMTGNPRGLEVSAEILERITPELERNIVDRGKELKQEFINIMQEFPGLVQEILGEGLLLSIKINPQYPVEGLNGIEQIIRENGVNVIHSSGNRLRFTPWFLISSNEINLLTSVLRKVFNNIK